MTDPAAGDVTPGCLDDDLAAELALGAVDGRERARALAHLAGCSRCRARVDALREVGESLLLLAGPAEPPAGFEQAVLARLRSSSAPGPARWRRALVAVAAAAVVAVALGAGVLIGRLDGGTAADRPSLTAAAMRTAAGVEVGTVWRHPGEPSWLLVSVPGWRRWETDGGTPREYRLELTLVDGQRIRIDDTLLRAADGTWATTITVAAGDVASVAVVDGDGRVWCTGTFPRSA